MTDVKHEKRTVVVIGAGIIGLTAALSLQSLLATRFSDMKWEVLIVAREWPSSTPGTPLTQTAVYASMWAGAHVRPIPASTPQLEREAAWLKQTVLELGFQVDKEPWAGVHRTPGLEFLEDPGEDYLNQTAESFSKATGLRGYRKLGPEELPKGVTLGFEYDSFCINPPVYCANLLRQFVLRGGKTLKKDIKCDAEVNEFVENIAFTVNASGMGFRDDKCFPTRGQTVVTDLVSSTKTVTRQNKDGSWSFIIPRSFNGGTIVGGTREPNNYSIEAKAETREALLNAVLSIEPYSRSKAAIRKVNTVGDIRVISDIVGRRPTREGGMRVELEVGTRSTCRHSVKTIHAYGAGGRGYELSWGVAAEVARLAEELLSEE